MKIKRTNQRRICGIYVFNPSEEFSSPIGSKPKL